MLKTSYRSIRNTLFGESSMCFFGGNQLFEKVAVVYGYSMILLTKIVS